jgi:hypothetical protein
MKTAHVTDYFAPIGRYTRLEELTSKQVSLPLTSFLPPVSAKLTRNKALQFDTADRFTYIIMGLAVLIAIVIPLLNLS